MQFFSSRYAVSTLSGISFPQNASLAPVNKITGENSCYKILNRETLRKQMFIKGVFLELNRVSKKNIQDHLQNQAFLLEQV